MIPCIPIKTKKPLDSGEIKLLRRTTGQRKYAATYSTAQNGLLG